jgi:hypothetical protein
LTEYVMPGLKQWVDTPLMTTSLGAAAVGRVLADVGGATVTTTGADDPAATGAAAEAKAGEVTAPSATMATPLNVIKHRRNIIGILPIVRAVHGRAQL